MSRRVTILGCGSSGGVPRIGNDWGQCDPSNPKNFRHRCSLLIEQTSDTGTTRLVIDTSPDFRAQALAAGIPELDGVWFTHDHADHTHGIDDLRGFFLKQRRRIPIWADAPTLAMLKTKFGYCFKTAAGSEYPPVLDPKEVEIGQQLVLEGKGGVIEGMPFLVEHGNINALGFRIGDLAYTPDLNGIPDESLPSLTGLDVWIVDALKRTPHPSHFHLAKTLEWIERLKPRLAILTNMHNDMDYDTLLQELPKGVIPAYDGMQVAL